MKNDCTRRRTLRVNSGKSVVLFLLCVFYPVMQSSAQDSVETTGGSIDWISGLIGITESYNDNILDYSSRDIYLLDNHLSASKFSIDRSFDAIANLKVRLGFSPRVFKQNPTLLRLRYTHALHTTNTIRNYLTWAVEVKQTFWRKNYASFEFSMLPSYYLRNLSYRDLTLTPRFWLKNTEARIQRKQYSFAVGRNFTSRILFSVGYDYSISDYNQELDERDNTTHRLIVDGSVRLSSFIKVNADYVLASSWAKGRERSDSLTDISYRSHRLSAGALFSFKKMLDIPLNVITDVTVESQTFLSDKVYAFPPLTFRERYGDKYHYGRIDHYGRLFAEANYQIFNNVEIFLQYSWEQNITNLEETLDAGSYQAHQLGAGVEFSF